MKYKFKIENEPHEWPEKIITGKDVRGIPPGIPDTMDLWLKEMGKKGRLISLDDEVDLSEPGIEKFYSQNASSEAGEWHS